GIGALPAWDCRDQTPVPDVCLSGNCDRREKTLSGNCDRREKALAGNCCARAAGDSQATLRARVRTAFRAAAERPWGPLVRTAFIAAALRAREPRFFADCRA